MPISAVFRRIRSRWAPSKRCSIDPHALTQRAQAGDVPVELAVWEDMPHVWHHFASILPESQQDMAHIGEFVREYVA